MSVIIFVLGLVFCAILGPSIGVIYISAGLGAMCSASMIGRHFNNQFLQAQAQYYGAKAQCEALNRIYKAVRGADDEKSKKRDELLDTLSSQKAWLLERFDTVVA